MIIIPPRPLELPALRGRIDERLRCAVCQALLGWGRGYGVCAGLFCESCFLARFHIN